MLKWLHMQQLRLQPLERKEIFRAKDEYHQPM